MSKINLEELVFTQRIHSIQPDTTFIKCNDPITLDKSRDWGGNNLQNHPNGAFIKVSEIPNPKGLPTTTVSHLVASNKTGDAPRGWYGLGGDTYRKKPIWITGNVILPKVDPEVIAMNTADGPMEYKITQPSMIVCNRQDNGSPDLTDCWLMTISQLKKLYNYISQI